MGNHQLQAGSRALLGGVLAGVAPSLGGPLDAPDTTITASGLKIIELEVGSGDEATPGQTVVVHYLSLIHI